MWELIMSTELYHWLYGCSNQCQWLTQALKNLPKPKWEQKLMLFCAAKEWRQGYLVMIIPYANSIRKSFTSQYRREVDPVVQESNWIIHFSSTWWVRGSEISEIMFKDNIRRKGGEMKCHKLVSQSISLTINCHLLK